jgi:hypothetical protein
VNNPLLKYLVKQVEDNGVMLEKYMKSKREWLDSDYENEYKLVSAFNDFHSVVCHIKNILEGMF